MFRKGSRVLRLGFAPLLALLFTVEAALPAVGSVQAKAISANNFTTVSLGEYPQCEVSDSDVYSRLNEAASEWTSFGFYINGEQSDYMKYSDVKLDGEKYRGVRFSEYRPFNSSFRDGSKDSSYQDDNGYTVGNTYWFKYESVCWRVLDAADDGTALLITEKILDVREFSHTNSVYTVYGNTVYPNNYRYSNIQTWLADAFYNCTFSETDKELLNAVSDKNYGCENIRLPEKSEVNNAFSEYTQRTAVVTDYAKCLGSHNDSENGFCSWWLGTVGEQNDTACRVDGNGMISDDFVDNCLGIRPIIVISLNSDTATPKMRDCTAETVQPTCTESGYNVYTCAYCGEKYTADYVSPTGRHSEVTDPPRAAACTSSGLTEGKHCGSCGKIIVPQSEISAYGHDWGQWTVETASTFRREGTSTRECSLCHAKESKIIARLPAEISVDANARYIKLDGNLIIVAPSITAKELITATGGMTEIYINGEKVVFDDKTALSTCMRLVLVSDGKILTGVDLAVLGDVDCDGKISVADARAALRTAVGLDVISGAVRTAACISHAPDNAVSVSDARSILRAAVGLDDPAEWFQNI